MPSFIRGTWSRRACCLFEQMQQTNISIWKCRLGVFPSMLRILSNVKTINIFIPYPTIRCLDNDYENRPFVGASINFMLASSFSRGPRRTTQRARNVRYNGKSIFFLPTLPTVNASFVPSWAINSTKIFFDRPIEGRKLQILKISSSVNGPKN